LAGVRASFPQIVLANVPYLLAFPLLKPVPALFFPLYSYMLVLTNNWVHMNVTWQSRKLEWLFVTPRYHPVHHLREMGELGRTSGSSLPCGIGSSERMSIPSRWNCQVPAAFRKPSIPPHDSRDLSLDSAPWSRNHKFKSF
jgi:hypothetical protein